MKSNKFSLSRSARFSICKRRGASLLLFPAAYTSVQNLVTLVILDGLARFAYRFVVLFLYSWNSLSFTFLAFSDLPHLDLLWRSFNIRQQSQETNMARSACAHQKSSSMHEWTYRYQKKTTCKEWMLILQLQRRYNNIISCLNLYSFCIKKMINPNDRK